MARTESKRQKRLAKQKAKRNQKRREIKRAASMGLAEQLAAFESAPVVDCLVDEGIEERGNANLLIGRQTPTGKYAFGLFWSTPICWALRIALGKF